MTYPPQRDDQQSGGQQYGGHQYGGQQYGSQPYGGQEYGSQPYGGQEYGGQQYGPGGGPQAPQYGAPHTPGGGCGAPQVPGYGQQPMHRGTNTMSVVGLVTAFLIWPVGLVLSVIGLSQTKRTGESGRGLAIAGIVVSSLAALGSILLIIFTIGVAREAISEAEAERELAEQVVQNDGFAVAPTEDPVEKLQDLDEDFGLGLDDLDEDIAELEEALGNMGYVDGADPATCDAIWGAADDAVMNLFLDAALITDPDEALELVETTTARVEEVAADAPEEIRAELETLGEVLVMAVTVEALSEAETIQSETERATTAIGEYCFGG